MKATIDIPDALYRRVKARSALDGRSIRDVTIELYRRWLESPGPGTTSDGGPNDAAADWLTGWQAIGAKVVAASPDGPTTRERLVADRR